jgi:hypothetical protein
MKKIVVSVLMMLMVLFLSGNLNAKEASHTDTYFNVGFLGAVALPIPFPQVGVNFDWHANQRLMISPEIGVIFILYIPAAITPGIQLNYKVNKSFHVGCGVTLFTPIIDDMDSTTPCIKLNAGWIKNRVKYSVYILIPPSYRYEEEETNLIVGASISFRF